MSDLASAMTLPFFPRLPSSVVTKTSLHTAKSCFSYIISLTLRPPMTATLSMPSSLARFGQEIYRDDPVTAPDHEYPFRTLGMMNGFPIRAAVR